MNISFQSQFGQDKFLAQEIFKNKRNGYFIDIGAYDGITLSNTYYFEKQLGWTGVCVEPIPDMYAKLLINRDKNTRCINGCIHDKRGDYKFLHVIGGDRYDIIEEGEYPKIRGREHTEMLSGLLDKYPAKHLELIDRELFELGGKKEILTVKCYNFVDLLQYIPDNHIDYLSLDTEGCELNILQSINFEKIFIDAISVEVLYPEIPIQNFLEGHGYALRAICGYDHIYVKTRSRG